MKRKKGIALVTLVITIIVVLILVGVSVVSVGNSLKNTEKASLAEELSTIEEQVNVYRLQNGEEYPAYINSDGTLVSKTPAEIKEIVGEKKFAQLIAEMKLNKENGEEDVTNANLAFYVIDLDKLALDNKTKGIKKNGNEEDVYIVSAKTNRVYYLKGVKIGGTTYFSIVSLINYTNKVVSTEIGEVDVTQVGSLTVKRAKKSWTNTMGINLSVTNIADTTEIISATLLKDGELQMSTSNFTLQSEYEINSLADIPGATFTNQTAFNEAKNKVILFTRGGDTLAVDLSNYDPISPEFNEDSITKNIAENENIITFKVKDEQSGIKMVKYDYLQIYDDSGNISKYYKDTNTLEPSFIKARGKKADISEVDDEGYVTVTIRLPYKVEGIQVYIEDKAGNYTKDNEGNPITIGVYDFDNDPYIGCNLKSITNSGLTFKAIFNTNDETKLLNLYNVQISTDNTTYTGDYSETLTTSSTRYSKLIADYKSNIDIEKKAYVKIIATISGVIYERIFKFDISDNDNSEVVPVPNGFVASQAWRRKRYRTWLSNI